MGGGNIMGACGCGVASAREIVAWSEDYYLGLGIGTFAFAFFFTAPSSELVPES